MPNTAVLWIRDGVLVDRMHINSVAFAFAFWAFSTSDRRLNTTLEDLINFAFEKSGLSCADKMRRYNSEREDILMDVDAASVYYNALASEAAAAANYFTGAFDLLRDLQSAGVQNFITSAVEQDVLDTWSQGQQGLMTAPYLKEILGKRDNFSKGRDHFEYVSRGLSNQRIFYVADAAAEIQTGKQYSQEYNIIPIGFGNVITVERVLEAVELVSQALIACGIDTIPCPISVEEIQVDAARINLPDEHEVESALSKAGAESVITGTREEIMQNLRGFFEERCLLQPGPSSVK
jgi:phosphoglycolate phosphatase-like HAD superfamily hydrolase